MLQAERHAPGQLSSPSRKGSEHRFEPFPSKFSQMVFPCPFPLRLFRGVGGIDRIVAFVVELGVHLVVISHERAVVPVFAVLVRISAKRVYTLVRDHPYLVVRQE